MATKSGNQDWQPRVATESGNGEWQRRVVTKSGDQDWQPRVATNSGDQEWQPRMVTKNGNQDWWPRLATKSGNRDWQLKLVTEWRPRVVTETDHTTVATNILIFFSILVFPYLKAMNYVLQSFLKVFQHKTSQCGGSKNINGCLKTHELVLINRKKSWSLIYCSGLMNKTWTFWFPGGLYNLGYTHLELNRQ